MGQSLQQGMVLQGLSNLPALRADLLVRGCAGGRWAALASLGSWSPRWPFALSHHTFMWAHLVGTMLRLNTDLGYVPKGSTKAAQADLGDVPANAQNQTLACMLGKTTTALKKMKSVCRVAGCLSSINPLCSSNVLFLPTAVVCLLTHMLMRERSLLISLLRSDIPQAFGHVSMACVCSSQDISGALPTTIHQPLLSFCEQTGSRPWNLAWM